MEKANVDEEEENNHRGNGSSNKKKKKRKQMSEPNDDKSQPPPPPEGWDRCHAFVPRKSRYCRQFPNPGSKYCGNHYDLEENTTTNADNTTTSAATSTSSPPNERRKRIPCPVDGSHTIWADNLKKHVLICTATRDQIKLEQQAYHCKNCNAGGHGSYYYESDPSKRQRQVSVEEAQQLALRILKTHQRLFPTCTKDDVTKLTRHDLEHALPLRDHSTLELQGGLGQAIESYRIRSGGAKHLQQQASLVGHLRQLLVELKEEENDTDRNNNNTPPPKPQRILLLELGAGRGMTGLIAAGALAAASSDDVQQQQVQETSLIMIEKAATRSKAETILRNHVSSLRLQGKPCCLNIEGVTNWLRVQCDLADVHMPTVLTEFDQHKQCRPIQSKRNKLHPAGSTAATKEESNTPIKAPTPSSPDAAAAKEATNQENDNNDKSDDEPLPGSNSNNSQPQLIIAAIAKHLCGAGTDLALKALYPIRDQLDACIFATCCHGLCNWEEYVGRDYLRHALCQMTDEENGDNHKRENDDTRMNHFGKEEFELMSLWSSGTVVDDSCASKKEKKKAKLEPEDQPHTMPPTTKEQQQQLAGVTEIVRALHLSCGVQGFGRACQRLIDFGRCEYLRHELFATASHQNDESNDDKKKAASFVDLCHYVPAGATPQNAVLLARRQIQ